MFINWGLPRTGRYGIVFHDPYVIIFHPQQTNMWKKSQELGAIVASSGSKEKDTTESVIGPSVHLEGNFTSSGNVIIGGSLSGSMTTSGDVHVLEGARVQAMLTATHVLVAGEVRGDVKATDRLELTPTARVIGNIEAKVLTVTAGAMLHGKCAMKGNGVAKDVKETKAARATRVGAETVGAEL